MQFHKFHRQPFISSVIMDTANETSPAALRGFFFPLPSPGHMIPLIDIAKLLSRRGVSATIVTTPGNEPLARPTIDSANSYSSSSSSTAALPIDLILLPFPAAVTDLLPAGNCENLTNVPPSHFGNLMAAFGALQPSLQDLLRSHRPDFLVTDNIFVWAADMAAELGIPHIVFSGHGAFPLCVHERLAIINPLHRFSDDDTAAIRIDDIPNPIELTKPEVSDIFNHPPMLQWMKQAEEKSFGVVVNSFYELEPAYVEIFRRGHRAWFVGPVSLSNAEDDQIGQANRGREAHLDTARVMRWLDAQPARSVLYACFGSLCQLDAGEMREMAVGLEESGQRFIWAVRDWQGVAAETMEWLPEGFEERVESKGWVVRGWAPQVAILGHVAVGAFVTHCGWNSVLEGVAEGLPLVAWPLMYEQFVNERLIVDVLKVGVRMRKEAKEVAAAVRRVMGDGEEAEGFRRRARELAAAAKAAMEVGGSSYEDVGRLVEGLKAQVGSEGSRGKKEVG